ncbi:recombinase RecT (plasmid) [Cetobacterium somerae]|uniref:recombinase RecT n=1 Tax=Cetobacterium somerae TaxID=188913 RepID=UPI001F050C07|nr:recombinase RecT [Cetobacterium somerae]UPO98393.1 recombinase RecT [Cetobacterium somerae]
MARVKNDLVGSNSNSLSTGINGTGIPALKSLLATEAIRKQMKSLLGDKAGHFMMAIVGVVEGTPQLQDCEPQSIINSAIASATLDLPIEKNLGYAYIVPYKDKAQFQMGYKGYIQLALRSGQYKYINSIEIKEGELENYNLLTGEFNFKFIEDINQRLEAKTIGYASYIEFTNGFRNTLYMTKEQIENHAEKYSQSYGTDLKKGYSSSNWSKNFDSMALKTVLKLNLSKFGALSVSVQKALQIDGSSIKSISEEGTINIEYVDNTNEENKIIGNVELATNEEKLELLRQSDLIKFNINKKASELKIDFDTLTKKDLRILENIIDVETDKRMED